jgi:flavorubredoxin
METAFTARRITENVWWVGAIDWELRNFHGYLTSEGSTYNAYLITGSEPILVDTVREPFYAEMMDRIRSVMDPSEIRHVVSCHAEMDHSGSLPRLLEEISPDTLFASGPGQKALAEHFHWDQSVRVVKTGERLELGDRALRFVETRMLHWPDSMFTYLEGDDVLFSNDAFGMHLATAERFADELSEDLLRYEAGKYFGNILLPFSKLVTRVLDQLPGMNLPISVIAPDHGPVWRKDPARILDWYARWARRETRDKAVVIYSTMWKSTVRMAHAVGEGLETGGTEVKLMPLEGSHRSDVATELLDAAALAVGSPTMNGQIYPTVADVMTYLKGLKPANLIGAAFGSYGWSGEAVPHLEKILTDEMKARVPAPGVRVRYVPTNEDLARCRDLGAAVSKAIKDGET